jgi:hypothetical protein
MNVVGGRAQNGLFLSDAQAGKPGVLTPCLLRHYIILPDSRNMMAN